MPRFPIGVNSPLSIRMEGAFEELLAFGRRYDEARRAYLSITLDDLPIVRSRLEALVSEDATFQRLRLAYERLSSLASRSERIAVDDVVAARESLLQGLRWLANLPDADIATSWAAGRGRLRLVARVRSARQAFRTNVGPPSPRSSWSPFTWVGILALGSFVGAFFVGAGGVCLGIVLLLYVAVAKLRLEQMSAAPPRCSYCCEGAQGMEWFEDVPALHEEFADSRRGSERCGHCGLTHENFQAAMDAVPLVQPIAQPQPYSGRLPAAGYLR